MSTLSLYLWHNGLTNVKNGVNIFDVESRSQILDPNYEDQVTLSPISSMDGPSSKFSRQELVAEFEISFMSSNGVWITLSKF